MCGSVIGGMGEENPIWKLNYPVNVFERLNCWFVKKGKTMKICVHAVIYLGTGWLLKGRSLSELREHVRHEKLKTLQERSHLQGILFKISASHNAYFVLPFSINFELSQSCPRFNF